MPGFFHRGRGGSGIPHASTGVQTWGPVRGGAGPAGEQTHFNRLLTHQLPDRAATHCFQMRGLRQTGAAARERHGSSWTTRHDTIVYACSACRGSSTRSWRSRRTATPDQNQKPDIWLIDKCKTIDVGVTLPRQTDHYYNEKLRKQRDGTLPIVCGTDGSLHPVRRHLKELHVDVEKLSIRAALPPRTWPRRPASI